MGGGSERVGAGLWRRSQTSLLRVGAEDNLRDAVLRRGGRGRQGRDAGGGHLWGRGPLLNREVLRTLTRTRGRD